MSAPYALTSPPAAALYLCPRGVCVASRDGLARGKVSGTSDTRCRHAEGGVEDARQVVGCQDISCTPGAPDQGIGDIRSQSKGTAARYNGGKPDLSLIPMATLCDEARVWEYGKAKYAAWNWAKGMVWSAPFASLMRHMAAWQSGEDVDAESGLPHLAHAACNLRMLTMYTKTYPEGDDRPPAELTP